MSVRAVETIKPPITTVANGRCTSAPADLAMAIGTKPSEATRPVRNTGRNRCGQPSAMMRLVVKEYWLRLRISLKWLIMRIPFSTATPKRAMNPTPAEMLKGRPRSHRATIPPMSERGTVENTTSE